MATKKRARIRNKKSLKRQIEKVYEDDPGLTRKQKLGKAFGKERWLEKKRGRSKK